MCPEMLLKTGHTKLLDFYCVGVLLLELITGSPPFNNNNINYLYNNIL